MIQQAARKGDRVAKTILEETGFYLGVWLAGMISLLDPEAIVIGGGVSHIGKPLFDKIRTTIPSHTINGFAAKTPVLPAKLRTNVGVYGAAAVFPARWRRSGELIHGLHKLRRLRRARRKTERDKAART